MSRPILILAVGVSAGLLGACDSPVVERREITVQVHEGTDLSFDLSPDGRWIVLDLVGQLWWLPAAGGDAVALTDAVRDTAESHGPRWSPDGARIVFWRGFEPQFTYGVRPLWVLAVDSGVGRALVGDTVRYMDPAWHPSGLSLLVVHSASRTRPDDRLYLYDLASGALSEVRAESLPTNRARRLANPAWSPDERTIAVVDGRTLGPIWEVNVASGAAVRITPDGVQARQPAYAPDGTSIAYVEQDSVDNTRIWVQDRGEPGRRHVVASSDGAQGPTDALGRVAWTPDGRRLVFVRSGRLWSVAREGGGATEIPFAASIRFTQERPRLPPLSFPAPGSDQRARGFTGLALAPDADRVALIALDSLWLVTLDGRATSIAGVRENASGLTWSPDGRMLAWSAGPKGEEDLYATDVTSGATRALTALRGTEMRPAWSPDGRWVAFLHYAVAEGPGAEIRLRILAPDGALIERADQTTDLGPAPGASIYTPLDMAPQWSRDGSSVLLARANGEILLAALEGDRRTRRVPPGTSAVRRIGADSVVYLLEDRLYVARLGVDSSTVTKGQLLTEEPALYPVVARDGTMLYVSTDGLRVRHPNGSSTRLGWPIRFRTPSPPRLVIRNARLVEREGSAGESCDIVIANGRIERIGRAGNVRVDRGTDVVDAEGRFVIPGLIELHQHPRSETQLAGLIYFGITTVRDMGNPIATMAARRDAVTAGVIPGPRMVVAGLLFYPGCIASGEAWCGFTEFEQNPSSDSAAARGLALAEAFGIGVVKLYSPGTLPAARRFLDMAHRQGLRVTGHFGYNLPLLASGMEGKEHVGADIFPPAFGDVAALARAAGLVITPTLAVVRSAWDFASDTAEFSNPELAAFTEPADRRWYSGPPFVASRIPEIDRIILGNRADVRRLHDAGVILGAGTDVVAPVWAVHTELEELVASGLTPAEALAAATSTAARVLGAERDLGAVAPGRIADLVILDANPLWDIRNTRRIWQVIQGGRVVDRGGLLREAASRTARPARHPTGR